MNISKENIKDVLKDILAFCILAATMIGIVYFVNGCGTLDRLFSPPKITITDAGIDTHRYSSETVEENITVSNKSTTDVYYKHSSFWCSAIVINDQFNYNHCSGPLVHTCTKMNKYFKKLMDNIPTKERKKLMLTHCAPQKVAYCFKLGRALIRNSDRHGYSKQLRCFTTMPSCKRIRRFMSRGLRSPCFKSSY